jgi:predicted SAM-dependent methyltransferase
VILLFEVIEHLDLEQGRAMMARIFLILNGGGRVILSTPNVYTPGHYWKAVSHLTPYHYDELGGLLLSQGFEVVEICRYFHDAFLRFFLKVHLLHPVFRLMGVDFSQSIFLVAKKA